MADKCPCLIPDENDCCTECGAHIDLPDIPAPDLGDIVGIIKLIDATVKSYVQLVVANTDPTHPELPRLRMIGGVIMRVSHKMIFRELYGPSFKQAKSLGYRGSLERWSEILQEAVENPQHPRL